MIQPPIATSARRIGVLATAGSVCGLGWLLAWQPAGDLANAVAYDGASSLGRMPLEDVLAGICGVALLACSAWLLVVTTLLVVQAWATDKVTAARQPRRDAVLATLRATDRVTSRLCPRLARRVVLVTCGAALTSSPTVPAMADPTGAGDTVAAASAAHLSGLALPDRAAGRAAPRPRSVVVVSGDSLWTISRAALGAGATDAEVLAACTALHKANLGRIGDDPDLIFPGTTVRIPRLHLDRKELP